MLRHLQRPLLAPTTSAVAARPAPAQRCVMSPPGPLPGRHHPRAGAEPHHGPRAAGAGVSAPEAPGAPRHQGVRLVRGRPDLPCRPTGPGATATCSGRHLCPRDPHPVHPASCLSLQHQPTWADVHRHAPFPVPSMRPALLPLPPQPANILVNLQGEAKIADFGISAFVANTVANVSEDGCTSWRLARSMHAARGAWHGPCSDRTGSLRLDALLCPPPIPFVTPRSARRSLAR